MRLIATFFVIIIIPLICSHDSRAISKPDIYLSSDTIYQGEPCLIRIRVKKGETPRVTWMGKEIFMISTNDKTCWQGFLAADLMEKPGHYQALVKISPSGREEVLTVAILDKDYGVRRLTLPKKMVELDSETLARARKEAVIMKKLWEAPASTPIWRGPLLRPVQGDVVGPFGRRSVINNQPRSPHTGVDLRGEKGSAIRAVNNGRVVLTSDHFFTGRSVVLDHGGEIMSMYFHLEKILVQEGDVVVKGQIIGLVGSTGRATGPHLHWGMRVNGARVNPLRLMALSQELEE